MTSHTLDRTTTRRAVVAAALSGLGLGAGCLGTPPERNAGRPASSVTRTTTAEATTDSAEASVTETPGSTPPVDDPRLADVLVGLVRAEDRAAYAASENLDYRDGRVRVVVELESGAEPPSDVSLERVVRTDDAVEASVRPDDLPRLAAAPGVRVVRPPRSSTALQPSDPDV